MVKLALDVKNSFESYLCVGVVSMIFFHIFENIGMNIGLLPITGIPLPFISYGGSSLMGNMLGIGLIFSISYRRRAFMFG
jgi:rod shape determining protein RodA